MYHGYCTPAAFLNASAAIPAFLRVKDDGRLALLRIGHHNVIRANIHALIAAYALFGIESYADVGGGWIGHHVDFLFHPVFSLTRVGFKQRDITHYTITLPVLCKKNRLVSEYPPDTVIAGSSQN